MPRQTVWQTHIYLRRKYLCIYLFVCIYLFIYTMITMVTATVNSAEVLKKSEGRRTLWKDWETTWKKERWTAVADVSTEYWQRGWHLGHIKIAFWKIFLFIFYVHFCKITNLRRVERGNRWSERTAEEKSCEFSLNGWDWHTFAVF